VEAVVESVSAWTMDGGLAVGEFDSRQVSLRAARYGCFVCCSSWLVEGSGMHCSCDDSNCRRESEGREGQNLALDAKQLVSGHSCGSSLEHKIDRRPRWQRSC
jgi:hypothetical protein